MDRLGREDTPTTVAQSNDEGLDVSRELPAFDRHIARHPVVAHIISTGDDNAVAVSDLIDREAFRKLELYREFFAAHSVEDQLSVGYLDEGALKGVSVNRATWGFSMEERRALTQIARCIFPYYRLLQRTERETVRQLPPIEVTVDAIVAHHDLLELTPREAELLGEIARGKSNKQIAAACGLSEGTVRKHLENAFRRLDVNNRVSAVMKAMQLIRRTIDERRPLRHRHDADCR